MLREELKTTLDEMTYKQIVEDTAAISENVITVNKDIPVLSVYTG